MDHLPIPAGVTRYPFDIPIVCTENYDYKDFATYPTRKGYDISKLVTGNFDGLEDLPKFLQTWLYFGLLSSILGVNIDYREFEMDGLLSTVALPRYLEEWKARVDEFDADARIVERDRTYMLLVEATRVGRWLTPKDKAGPIPQEIVLSMQVLVSTFAAAGSWIWQIDGMNYGAQLNEWRNSSLVMWYMHGTGWCPYTIKQYFAKMNSATMAYLSMFGRPDDADHGGCSWDECVGRNINMSEYQTKHVREGCDCSFLEVPQMEVRDIIRGGGIPALSLRDGCVFVEQAKEYVAISHVWKDGLGNVGHNSLPECQLEMISEKIAEVGCSTFWIDTICVPAEVELKAAALDTMGDVYRHAQKVLVLDASLRNASCKNGPTETFLRIFTCGWLTRLWTFQEAALAGRNELRAVFADGIAVIDYGAIDDLMVSYRLTKSWKEASNMIVAEVPLPVIAMLRSHSHSELDSGPGERLMRLWLGLRDRAVSNPADEYLVFATMLGLDPGRLSLFPDSDKRMKGLLDMVAGWPQTLLFADGRRLRMPGYQWAPASFLGSWPGQPGNIEENARLGARTESGLLIQRPVTYALVETQATCMSKMFLCKEENSGQWYSLRYLPDENPDDVPEWSDLCPRKGIRIGLLIADRRSLDGSKWALLVTIKKEEDDIIYATYGCRLVMQLLDHAELVSWADTLSPWKRPEEDEAQKLGLWPEEDCWQMFGRMNQCAEDQMWCVG